MMEVGIFKRFHGGYCVPVYVAPLRCWRVQWRAWRAGETWYGGMVGLFRNLPGVVKWKKGRLLPRRWGFYVWGLEIGQRG